MEVLPYIDSILTATQSVCTIIILIFQMKKERHSQLACLGAEMGRDLHLSDLQTHGFDPCAGHPPKVLWAASRG